MTPGEEKRKNETLKKTVGKTSGFSLREVVREWMNKTPPDENTRGKRREGKTNDVPENNKRRAPQQQMTFPETTNDVPENNKRRSQKQQTTFPETTNDVPENNKRRSQKQQTTCPEEGKDARGNDAGEKTTENLPRCARIGCSLTLTPKCTYSASPMRAVTVAARELTVNGRRTICAASSAKCTYSASPMRAVTVAARELTVNGRRTLCAASSALLALPPQSYLLRLSQAVTGLARLRWRGGGARQVRLVPRRLFLGSPPASYGYRPAP